MANESQLEQSARRYLQSALDEARRGADPRRVHRGSSFTCPVGQTREQIRARVARDYERSRLRQSHGGERQAFGVVVLIVETTIGGALYVNAEAFDLEAGTSVVVMQPVKKSLGRWKARGPTEAVRPAEPLPVVLAGPALRYDLQPLPVEERRRLLGELSTRSIPHVPDGASVFVGSDDESRVTSINGWPQQV